MANVVVTIQTTICEIKPDFFYQKRNLLLSGMKDMLKSELLREAHNRLEKIINENQKKWFFKKPETLEQAHKECHEEFNLQACIEYYQRQELSFYDNLIQQIENEKDVDVQDIKSIYELLKKYSVVSMEEYIKLLTEIKAPDLPTS